MKRKLTNAHLRTATTPDTRRELRDGGGLSLKLYPTGAKSWHYTYFLDGRKRRLTLGEYPAMGLRDARRAHEEAHAQVRQGIDPARVRKQHLAELAAARESDRAATTIEKLCSRYIDEWAKKEKRERTWKEYQRQLNSDVVPTLGQHKAREVTQDDLQDLLDAVVARGAPVSANRLKAVLGSMFKWAKRNKIVRLNPVIGIDPLAAEKPRDRVLTESEVRVFWNGLDATPLSDAVKSALRLVLVTAQRPGEVAGMQYEELADQDGRVLWTIPGSRRKNKMSHVVPLSGLALELIGEREGMAGAVLIGSRGARVTTHALSGGLRRNIGTPEPSPPKKRGKRKRVPIELAAFTPHDLRRTAATLMSNAGVSGLTKPMVLGHTPQDVTKRVYDLFDYLPEKSRALDLWASRLRQIITGKKPGKVVVFPS